ncbi:hypothetical protein BGZ79_009392 [Entomortierella chlamydospora]|nr:hypothetical protein BGZ79_009392 [Entomortierella chlamydospora]
MAEISYRWSDPISKGERRSEFASVSTEYFYDGQDDDSYYLREAAYLREQEQERAERYQQQDEDPWLSHLFDELANDDPYEFHSDRFEAQSFEHYYERDARSHINDLSDADYTYYMRRGMKRSRQAKADKEWMEWVEEQEKVRYQQAREEQKRKDERRSRKRQERKERKEDEARVRGETDSSMENSPANRLRKKALNTVNG